MEAIKKYLSGILSKFKTLSMNEYLILALVASVFVSVYLLSALILLLPVYFTVTRQTQKALPKNKYEYALLAFAFLAMLSTFLYAKDAVFRDLVIKAVWLKLLSIGIIILAFDIFFFTRIMTKRAFHLGLVLSSVLSISSFVIAAIQKILGIYPDPIHRPGRVASIFFNENYYSTVIEFVVVISLYLLYQSESKRTRFFYGFVVLVNIIGLYLSQCRAAYVAVVVSVAMFVILHLKKKHLGGILIGLFIVVSVFLFCSTTFDFALLERFDLAVLTKDLDFRIGIWETAFQSFKEYPLLGRGYYAYGAVMNEIPGGTTYVAIHAHNLLVEILMDFGVMGSAFLLAFCAYSVARGIKASFRTKNRNALALIVSALLSIAIHGMVDITLIFPQTGFFAVFLLFSPQTFCKKEEE